MRRILPSRPLAFGAALLIFGGLAFAQINPGGGGGGGGGGALSPNVGAATIATGQYTNATGSATQVVAARTGAPGTGRVSITLYDSGTTTCFIGVSGETTSTGIQLLAGGTYTLYTTAAVYALASSGTCALSYLESY